MVHHPVDYYMYIYQECLNCVVRLKTWSHHTVAGGSTLISVVLSYDTLANYYAHFFVFT